MFDGRGVIFPRASRSPRGGVFWIAAVLSGLVQPAFSSVSSCPQSPHRLSSPPAPSLHCSHPHAQPRSLGSCPLTPCPLLHCFPCSAPTAHPLHSPRCFRSRTTYPPLSYCVLFTFIFCACHLSFSHIHFMRNILFGANIRLLLLLPRVHSPPRPPLLQTSRCSSAAGRGCRRTGAVRRRWRW